MSHIRYFVMRLDDGWGVRRDSRPLGAAEAELEAVRLALEAAAVDRVRGHLVDVVKQDADGRWTPCPPHL